MNCLYLKSPLDNAPKVYCYTLLIGKLGPEIIAKALCFRHYRDIIHDVADVAVKCD